MSDVRIADTIHAIVDGEHNVAEPVVIEVAVVAFSVINLTVGSERERASDENAHFFDTMEQTAVDKTVA